MKLRWTFGQKISAGFAVLVLLTLSGSFIGVQALRTTVAEKDRVIDQNAANLNDAAQLQGAIEWKVASMRGFLLSPKDLHLNRMREADTSVTEHLRQLRTRVAAQESIELLRKIEAAYADYSEVASRTVESRKGGASAEQIAEDFDTNVAPKRTALDTLVDDFVALEKRHLDTAEKDASDKAEAAQRLEIGVVLFTVVVAIALALYLSRRLGKDLGAAIEHIRSSSAELQSASNQQATSTREQATSMSEISTTVSELLATSRQIASSAQRVAHVASETATAARSGDQTVRSTHESITAIKQHVDHVVTYMLDLGRKSQQIGGVVDIINELAEQTNILSINASIEAAGAGEGGRRFAVVADEIRKLAERVGGSTREITALIEEIRAAVNTTVMATEGGAKAVEAGARQFGEVTAAFDQIVQLVAASTDSAREIELSTKQQATAVEQVNVAIVNAAQATKESEAGSSQTLQTAGQLAGLSGELAQLV